MANDQLHQRAEADKELLTLKAETGNNSAYQYAAIYAQRGDIAKAPDWIETAYELRDSGLTNFKVDYFLNPLRKEPRFQEIERMLKFPT